MSQASTIEQYVNHVDKLCSSLDIKNWTVCSHFDDRTFSRLQVKNAEQIIISILGHDGHVGRMKRGVLNFVGQISKVLFGTMDEDDAQYYNDQIEHSERSSDSLTSLLKQQLSVVKSSLGALNETSTDMVHNDDRIREGLTKLQCYTDSFVSQTGNATDLLTLKIMVGSHIARILDALNVLQRSLDVLINSITEGQKGVLQPLVVPATLLMIAFIHNSPLFPRGTSLPFPLGKDSVHLLYKVCDDIYVHCEILGYVVSLPLVSKGSFDILRVIPILIMVKQNHSVYIDVDKSVLCLDKARQYYFMLEDRELELCKTTDRNTYICKQVKPLFSSHALESCTVKMLQP
jgi:hypothetical protein